MNFLKFSVWFLIAVTTSIAFPSENVKPTRPSHVFLISIDTLSAQHMSLYSIPDFPSHTPINFASLLTGTHPEVHGITDGPMHVEGRPLSKPSAAGFSSVTKRVAPIWKELFNYGKKIFLLSVPGSTPPEIPQTVVKGRWGNWGSDTTNVVFESDRLLEK